jgi:glycosyltransferase involved in cell wall biosynthesis
MRAWLGASRRRVAAAAGAIRDRRRHRAIRRDSPARGRTVVFYGHEVVPAPEEAAHGGMVKLQELTRVLPNDPGAFNVLYLGSSTFPRDGAALVELARERGAALVWNQNGVAYPGWHGPGWERVNAPRARALHAADHVLYQSEFCKLAADRFYGERRGPWEILYNPVDTGRFTPADRRPEQPTLLLAGTQYQRYRVETALRTLARVPAEWRLVVTGELLWDGDEPAARREAHALIAELGLGERVELIGPYTQVEAPAIYRRATLLLHTKYNDPCPTVVLEALASGLPVVYSASGGVLELVSPDAGVGIPAPLDWEQDHPPDPADLAAAIEALAGRVDEASRAARRSAERFDAGAWIGRHCELFDELAR